MEFNVKIDPEDINKKITQAVAESAIGIELTKTIKKQVDAMSTGYNNPMEPIIKNEISNILRELIRSEYMPQIKEFIKKNMTEKFTSDLLNKMWDKLNQTY